MSMKLWDGCIYPAHGMTDGVYRAGSRVRVLSGEIAGRRGVVVECQAKSPDVRKYVVDVDGRGAGFCFHEWELEAA